jgi:polysaccharide export outer membrane protein
MKSAHLPVRPAGFAALGLLMLIGWVLPDSSGAQTINPITPSTLTSPPATNLPPGAVPPSVPTLTPEKGGKFAKPKPEEQKGQLPLIPLEEEPLSAFEEYVKMAANIPEEKVIRQFGYELFRNPPDTFAPADFVPVTPDYLLGPGDEVKISLWGKINGEVLSEIDREGNINFPQVGLLHLSGLSYAEAKDYLRNAFSKYYKPSEVKMNVSLGNLRSLRVFMVGDVKSPGAYTLSSLSTVSNALFAAGGPAKTGSMRDIQVRRNGKTVVSFDLYDFLLRGDKTGDVRLMTGDVIFVPPVGPLVAVAGYVNHPAIYELKGETRLSDLIRMAGGLTAVAYTGRVQVQRVEDHTTRSIFDSDLLNLGSDPSKDIALSNGDVVKVFSVMDTTDWNQYRTVRIEGAVKNPGEYTMDKGATLSSLIDRAGGFTENAYLKGAIFTRETVRKLQQTQLDEAIDRLEQQLFTQSAQTIEAALSPDAAQQQQAAMEQRRSLIAKMRAAKAKGRMTIHLTQMDTFKGAPSDIALEDGDVLHVPERPNHIQVLGAVYNQTAFLYDPKATTASYLEKAGGMTQDAEEDALYVLRIDGSAISKREAGGFFRSKFMHAKLDPGDTIVVPEKIERIAYLREFKDITQILYQIAVTAGVLIVVF